MHAIKDQILVKLKNHWQQTGPLECMLIAMLILFIVQYTWRLEDIYNTKLLPLLQ